MESPEIGVQSSLISGNYSQALNLSIEWIQSFPLETKNTVDYLKAQEAYLYCSFLDNRSEHLNILPLGRDRALFFLECLEKLKEYRSQYEAQVDSFLWDSVKYVIHYHISINFARDLAGQKSYNLKEEDIIQLGYSLIQIENYKGADEALSTLLKLNKYHPLGNLLLGHIKYELGDYSHSMLYWRYALFLNPDILKNYEEYLPEKNFSKLWIEVQSLDMSIEVKYRYFALLTEIYDLYLVKNELTDKEFKKIEGDFRILYGELEKNSYHNQKILPRALHYLTWLIYYSELRNEEQKSQLYKDVMNKLDPDMYSLFQNAGIEITETSE